MNICESLTVTANLFPQNTAIVFDGHSISYSDLNNCSLNAARQLTEAGIQPGDRVALMLPNSPSFPIWYYGALRIGAIAVSISTRLAPAEVEFVVSDCEAVAFVGSESSYQAIEASLPECVVSQFAVDDLSGQRIGSKEKQPEIISNDWYQADPDEAALILYTSGTTGFPKGATLSHGNVRSNVHAFNHLCNMQPQDRILLAVPLFHCFGQNALLNSVLNVGGTIILQQRFDLNETRRLIAEEQVTQLYGVPMMFGLLLESCQPAELSSVTYCFSAAATLPLQTGLAWQEKFGLPIYEGYGLTETSPFATYNHRIKFVPGSIGMPIDSVEMKIVDTDSGQDCSPDELGEIAIRGPNVMLGYWNRPDETADAIRDGWFHSGDIGRIDEHGYLYIVDRVKDMITVGGLKVFPAEVERVLLDHPEVSQAAVIGVPDQVFGEQVVGYLVLKESIDQATALASIEQHAKSELGNYKIPRRLLAIDELPRNPAGKILKTRLREIAARTLGTQSKSSPDAATLDNLRPATLRAQLAKSHRSEKQRVAQEFLRELAREVGQLDALPEIDHSFIEAGLDSLAIVGMSAQLQVETGSALPATLLFDYPRLSDLAGYLLATIDPSDPDSGSHDRTADSIVETATVKATSIRQTVENMSEDEALDELMKELD